MDFNDTPEEAAYREQARKWLADNAADHKSNTTGNGRQANSPEHMKAAKAWQTRKAEAGYACITWPKEWGGGGGTPIQQVIFNQEEAKAGVNYGYFTIGLGMCVPTVMAFCDDDTKKRFVGPAVKGEEIWCQLFSEPAGGSDVAASRTRAVKADDGSGDWIINGQKVWTTGAQYCDYGI
ncbi:MAG TPA: acyl-CoA dehydrogenase family protein, partial [Caulobacteraceae bacterium]